MHISDPSSKITSLKITRQPYWHFYLSLFHMDMYIECPEFNLSSHAEIQRPRWDWSECEAIWGSSSSEPLHPGASPGVPCCRLDPAWPPLLTTNAPVYAPPRPPRPPAWPQCQGNRRCLEGTDTQEGVWTGRRLAPSLPARRSFRFVSGAGGLWIGTLLAGIKMKEMYEEGSGAWSLRGHAVWDPQLTQGRVVKV